MSYLFIGRLILELPPAIIIDFDTDNKQLALFFSYVLLFGLFLTPYLRNSCYVYLDFILHVHEIFLTCFIFSNCFPFFTKSGQLSKNSESSKNIDVDGDEDWSRISQMHLRYLDPLPDALVILTQLRFVLM